MLGGLLLDSSLIPRIAPGLPAEAFYVDQHRYLYPAIVALGESADQRTVQAWLEERGHLGLAGGLSYLYQLDLDLPDIGRIDAYVAVILRCWYRRRLIETSLRTAKRALIGELEPDAVLGEALTGLQEVAASSAGGAGFEPGDDILAAYIEEVEEQMILGAKPREQGMMFGVSGVDALTGGVERGKMWILAGYPGTGKTSAMLQMLAHEALQKHRHVAVFSLEMGKADLLLRLVSQEEQIASRRLRKRQISPMELHQLKSLWIKVRNGSEGTRIHVDDQGGIDMRKIELRLRRLASKVDLSGVMLDYLTLVGGGEDVPQKAQAFRDLCKSMNLMGLVLAQFSRDAEKQGRRPRMSDLREGGEEPADGILALWREYVPQADGNAWRSLDGEALVLKNRYGETGVSRYRFDPSTQRIGPLGFGGAT